jgi:hypothetical protein
MKKILLIACLFTLMGTAASAQTLRHRGMNNRTGITRLEAMDLRRDHQRIKVARFRAQRDGIVTPVEKRKLRKMKRHQRREFFFYKNNRNRRIL